MDFQPSRNDAKVGSDRPNLGPVVLVSASERGSIEFLIVYMSSCSPLTSI